MRRLFRIGTIVGLSALVAAGGITTPSYAQAPDPDSVYVQSIRYEGTGCPQGSVGSSFANDRQSFTLVFDSFVASIGPGVAREEARKRCELDVDLKAPDGWSWAVVETTARGYVSLPADVRAESQLQYSSHEGRHANNGRLSEDAEFNGPVSKDYLLTNTSPRTAINWSRCGGTNHLYITAEVSLKARHGTTPQAQITMDSIDGKVQIGELESRRGIQLVWQRCN